MPTTSQLDALISHCHELDSFPRLDDQASSAFFLAFPLPRIFELLSTGQVTDRPMHVISSVLDRLLISTGPGKAILTDPSTLPFLHAALNSSFAALRRLAVHTLKHGLLSAADLGHAEPIFLQLINAMSDRDTGVASLAEESLSSWAGVDSGRKSLLLQKIPLSQIAESSDGTIRLRALSLMMSLSVREKGAGRGGGGGQVARCLKRELLDHERDPLSAMACLELTATRLISMNSSASGATGGGGGGGGRSGLVPLIEEVALALSLTLAPLIEDQTCRSMAIGSAAQIIGCSRHLGITGDPSTKIECLLLKTIRLILGDSANGSSEEEITALDALTRLTHSGGSQGAQIILADSVVSSAVFERALGGAGRTSNDQVKTTALHTLALIADQDLSIECEALVRKLIYQSAPISGPVDSLLKLLSLPFEEPKEAALRVLCSIVKGKEARLYFGAELIRNDAMMTLLLDPRSQNSPGCATLRHTLLSNLIDLSHVQLSGNEDTEKTQQLGVMVEASIRLKEAVAGGPYGVMVKGREGNDQEPQVLVATRV